MKKHNYKFGDIVEDLTTLNSGDMYAYLENDSDIFVIGYDNHNEGHSGKLCSLFPLGNCMNRHHLGYYWDVTDIEDHEEDNPAIYVGSTEKLFSKLRTEIEKKYEEQGYNTDVK